MKNIFLSLIFLSVSLFSFSQKNIVNHKLHAIVNPETSELTVIDSITISVEYKGEFLLNADFPVFATSKNIKLKKLPKNIKAGDTGMDRDNDETDNSLKVTKYKIIGKDKSFVISYKGKIASEIEQSKENYQRGFSQSAGIISNKGIYLI